MIPLSSAVSASYTWSKIPRSRNYECRLNGEVIGTLSQPSMWSSKFVAETQAGKWIFRRGGFLGNGSEILDANSQAPTATFRGAWGYGGTLSFLDGQDFQIECKGWWRPVWTVRRSTGEPVLHLHTREKKAEVVGTAGVEPHRTSLLMMFLLYRVRQAEEDAAATAALMAAS